MENKHAESAAYALVGHPAYPLALYGSSALGSDSVRVAIASSILLQVKVPPVEGGNPIPFRRCDAREVPLSALVSPASRVTKMGHQAEALDEIGATSSANRLIQDMQLDILSNAMCLADMLA